MRVFAAMDADTALADVPAYVGRIEALGYDGLHVPETVHDVFMVALLALQRSSTLTVRTSVAIAFPRSPMVVAYAAWDLAKLSGGRFSLGLGAQVRGNIEGRYATPWTAPVERMREYVLALREIFRVFQSGGPLRFEGKHYRFTRLQPYFNPGPIAHPDIPIYLGGVNTRMCALAGEVADGLVTHPTSALPSVLDRIDGDLRGGERAAGRAPGTVRLVASAQFTAGTDRAAIGRNREHKRRLLAYLYSTPAYRPALEALGLGDRGDRLHALSRSGAWDAMPDVVDDAMLHAIAPAATYEDLAAVLAQRYARRADALVVAPPDDPAEDPALAGVIAQLRAMPAGRMP